ncbi:GTP-binding protein [Pueribacillus theae]|uniref:GTP-binding protein n=1 Tax=Pueribacillus theae TaxID=2171751 RepID=A0A2U1JZT0_9BACI|nr:GTP-binding protein [Pueribacillus theae]
MCVDESRREEFIQAVNKAYAEEMKKINDQLDKELLIALVGEVNAGKSTTINQILGKNVARTNPRPGETVSIDPYNHEGLEKIKFMDTPGLNDPNDENPKKTLEFIKKADIILFFTNAAGTVFSESEKERFQEIEQHNQNILIVLNKIDAAEDIDGLVQFIKSYTENKYDVIPISSKTGENIDELKNQILDLLKKRGKDLLFAKSMSDKSAAANRWIVAAGVSAGAIGAVPIPGSDVVPLTALQVGLLLKLSALYGKQLSLKDAKDLIIITAAKTVGQTLYRQVVKFIPGAGSAAGGVIASSLTLALGYGVKHAYENDIDINFDKITALFHQFRKRKKR